MHSGKLLILAKQIALMPSFICEFKKYLYNFLKNLTSKQPFAVIYFNRHLAKTYVWMYINFNINVGISVVGFLMTKNPKKISPAISKTSNTKENSTIMLTIKKI